MIRSRVHMMAAGTAAAIITVGGGVWLTGTASAAPSQAAAVAGIRHGRGDHGMNRGTLLTAPLAPSVPTDPAIFGVNPGKVPWVLRSGHVRLGAGGALTVEVSGLVVPPLHYKNPLTEIAAAVFCGGMQVAVTAPVPFSPKGNAHLNAKVTLPALCAAPAVLMEPASGTTVTSVYIAFDGSAPK